MSSFDSYITYLDFEKSETNLSQVYISLFSTHKQNYFVDLTLIYFWTWEMIHEKPLIFHKFSEKPGLEAEGI